MYFVTGMFIQIFVEIGSQHGILENKPFNQWRAHRTVRDRVLGISIWSMVGELMCDDRSTVACVLFLMDVLTGTQQ